jgi:hypothetical protein
MIWCLAVMHCTDAENLCFAILLLQLICRAPRKVKQIFLDSNQPSTLKKIFFSCVAIFLLHDEFSGVSIRRGLNELTIINLVKPSNLVAA